MEEVDQRGTNRVNNSSWSDGIISTTPTISSGDGNLTSKLHQTKNWVRIKIINKLIRRGAPWDHNVRTDPVLALPR